MRQREDEEAEAVMVRRWHVHYREIMARAGRNTEKRQQATAV